MSASQGGIVKPTKVPPRVSSKPGGGSGPAGGEVKMGKTPKPIAGNKQKNF